MKRLKTIIAAVLLVLWMPAASFCLIENAGLLAKSTGCCEDQSGDSSPCCALASASYKIDENAPIKALAISQLIAAVDPATTDFAAPEFSRVAECGVSPPELPTSWQFFLRAAAASRAPSSAS